MDNENICNQEQETLMMQHICNTCDWYPNGVCTCKNWPMWIGSKAEGNLDGTMTTAVTMCGNYKKGEGNAKPTV